MSRFGFGFGMSKKQICFSGPSYDPDAQAVFNYAPDFLDAAKPYFNDAIIAVKESGLWDNPDFVWFPCIPTRDPFKATVDIKSLTKHLTMLDSGALSEPYNNARQVYPTIHGFKFRLNGYLNTGITPNTSMTLNNSATMRIIYSSLTAAGAYEDGAFNSVTQSLVFSAMFTGSVCNADMYGTTNNSGRASVANDGAGAIYYANRRSSTYFSIIKEATTIKTVVSSQGTLPTVPVMINGFNNAGTIGSRRNLSSYSDWINFGSGISSAQEAIILPAFVNYRDGLERNVSFATNNVVFDGNSHLTYYLAATERNVGLDLFKQGCRFRNVGVSGQTTAAMNTGYAANVATLYSGTYAKNILVVVEGTNDLWFNGDVSGAISRMTTYVSNAKATGWTVVLCPVFCRNYSTNPAGLSQTAFNLAQDSYNQLVHSGVTGADYVVPNNPKFFKPRSDYASDAAYNTAVAALIGDSSEFYPGDAVNGTHLTDTAGHGYRLFAQDISTVISTII